MQQVARRQDLLGRVIGVLLSAVFLAVGISKLMGIPAMVREFDIIGFGQWFRYVTGFLEVAGALGLFYRRTVLLACGLLCCVMIGAIVAHLTRLGDSPIRPTILLTLLLLVGLAPATASRGLTFETI